MSLKTDNFQTQHFRHITSDTSLQTHLFRHITIDISLETHHFRLITSDTSHLNNILLAYSMNICIDSTAYKPSSDIKVNVLVFKS